MELLNRLKAGTAEANGDYGPWQSAFTMNALRRAWLPIRANQGRAGADGETIAKFERSLDENLAALRTELLQGRYRPHRVTQVLVPKGGGGWRPLSLWAIRDRVAQRAVYNYLEPAFEKRFLPVSYGFRSGLSTLHAAQAVHQARAAGAQWVLDADIKDCFGQMRTKIIMRRLREWRAPGPIRDLLHRWLRAEVWNAWQGNGRAAGTSQGGVVSPLLCNLYLHSFDEQMMARRGVWLVRYADDFLCLARDRRSIEKVQRHVATSLGRLGLELHPQKTRITTFDEGFQFVGWFFVRDEFYELK